MDEIVNPSRERLTFDKTVCDTLGLTLFWKGNTSSLHSNRQ
jgi:hypothetical protein